VSDNVIELPRQTTPQDEVLEALSEAIAHHAAHPQSSICVVMLDDKQNMSAMWRGDRLGVLGALEIEAHLIRDSILYPR